VAYRGSDKMRITHDGAFTARCILRYRVSTFVDQLMEELLIRLSLGQRLLRGSGRDH